MISDAQTEKKVTELKRLCFQLTTGLSVKFSETSSQYVGERIHFFQVALTQSLVALSWVVYTPVPLVQTQRRTVLRQNSSNVIALDYSRN